MQAIFIAYDQAHHENIIDLLTHMNCRGFTSFNEVQGRGSHTGEPHYGSHAWPSLASAMLTFVEDHRLEPVLAALHQADLENPKLGLRAWAWPVTHTI